MIVTIHQNRLEWTRAGEILGETEWASFYAVPEGDEVMPSGIRRILISRPARCVVPPEAWGARGWDAGEILARALDQAEGFDLAEDEEESIHDDDQQDDDSGLGWDESMPEVSPEDMEKIEAANARLVESLRRHAGDRPRRCAECSRGEDSPGWKGWASNVDPICRDCVPAAFMDELRRRWLEKQKAKPPTPARKAAMEAQERAEIEARAREAWAKRDEVGRREAFRQVMEIAREIDAEAAEPEANMVRVYRAAARVMCDRGKERGGVRSTENLGTWASFEPIPDVIEPVPSRGDRGDRAPDCFYTTGGEIGCNVVLPPGCRPRDLAEPVPERFCMHQPPSFEGRTVTRDAVIFAEGGACDAKALSFFATIGKHGFRWEPPKLLPPGPPIVIPPEPPSQIPPPPPEPPPFVPVEPGPPEQPRGEGVRRRRKSRGGSRDAGDYALFSGRADP